MKTIEKFCKAWKKLSDTRPRAGDWHYHQECKKLNYDFSVHEVDEGYLIMPCTRRGDPLLEKEDLRGCTTY